MLMKNMLFLLRKLVNTTFLNFSYGSHGTPCSFVKSVASLARCAREIDGRPTPDDPYPLRSDSASATGTEEDATAAIARLRYGARLPLWQFARSSESNKKLIESVTPPDFTNEISKYQFHGCACAWLTGGGGGAGGVAVWPTVFDTGHWTLK